MESPPSSSTWSEAFILSDDSGLLLTNGSNSSGSMSGHNPFPFECQDSDCSDKSFSQDDSLSDLMCGEHFNTLKKGPAWTIEPPLEFQDRPSALLEQFCEGLATKIILAALQEWPGVRRPRPRLLGRPYYAADFVPFSPCHGRPLSRSSLGSSRLSTSHNSLSVRADDSSFITQAVSHDALSAHHTLASDISDLYTVPFDSDVYAVPVDVVRPPARPRQQRLQKRRRRNTDAAEARPVRRRAERYQWCLPPRDPKRHSVAGAATDGEPIHMTLQEVRHYLQALYSSNSDSSESKERAKRKPLAAPATVETVTNRSTSAKKTNTFLINIKNKKVKDSCDNNKQISLSTPAIAKTVAVVTTPENKRVKKSPAKLFSFKQTLCNMFRFRRFLSPEHVNKCSGGDNNVEKSDYISNNANLMVDGHNNISSRALPPLPHKEIVEEEEEQEHMLDFATSIQRVKDYGWYWGPLSSEVAEKILSNEPDGSFIVRDSSDDHYIFSLTFKLNNCVRHVRIDHDQGNFSFGSCTKFKSQTIVEFIENAVEHSRSGRYLFFLHRRPVIGPVRVQLLHPVSRFKQVQSLQHICRFVIHKVVRRDLIPSLPLPRRMIDYLNTPHYYSEHVVDMDDDIGAEQQQIIQQQPIPADDIPNVPLNNYVFLDNNTSQQARRQT